MSQDSDAETELEDLHVQLLNAMKNENMIEIQEIIAHSKIEKLDIINYQIDHQPIHLAVWLGNERLILLLISENASFSAISNTLMDCLTIAVYRGHQRIVSMIISTIENPNFISKYGTALHIASQGDNVDIVKIMLQHPNIDLSVKYQGLLPREIAGPKTKKLLEIQERVQSSISQVSSYLSINGISENSFIANLPEKSPIIMGDVWQVILKGFYHSKVFITINSEYGLFCCYSSREHYPLKTDIVIPLETVRTVIFGNNYWFAKPHLNYIAITYQEYIQVARWWEEMLEKSLKYYKYLSQKCSQYKANGQLKKMEIMIAMNTLQSLKQPTKVIEVLDQPSLHQGQYIKNMQQVKSRQYSPKMEIVSEQSQNEDDQLQALVLSDFKVICCFGKGSFGFVYQVEYRNKLYALKQQDKEMLMASDNLRYALAEVNIIKKLYHPYIVNCLMSFQTTKNLYLLLEFCSGGDLAMYMTRGVILAEGVTKILIGQILLAIEYLHSKNILYRDLKPENVAVALDGNLKLIDFGLSTEIRENNLTYTLCGSPAYLAPEILLNEGSSQATDIYQIGLLLFEMLTGYPPFYTKEVNVLLQNIKQQSVQIPKQLSKDGKDLLGKILKREPKKRISILEIKKHSFFAEIDWQKLEAKHYKPPLLKKCFQQSSRANGVLIDTDACLSDYIQGWNFSRC